MKLPESPSAGELRQVIAGAPDIRAAISHHLRRARTKHARNRCLVLLDWADGLSHEDIRRKVRLSKRRVGAIIREAVGHLNRHAAEAPDADALVRGWLALPEPHPGRPRQVSSDAETRVLAAARGGARPRRFSQLARELGIHRVTCYKILQRAKRELSASQ
jgi:transposase